MSDILYTVNLWESNPNEGGDDCITGADYVLESEAIEAFNNPGKAFPWKGYANWQYIDLCRCVGEDSWEEVGLRKNPNYVPEDDVEDNEWAMLQGMSFGVEAYNEAMGYGTFYEEEV